MTLALFFKPFLDKNLRKKFQFQALRKYRLAPFLQVCCRPAPIQESIHLQMDVEHLLCLYFFKSQANKQTF